MPAAPQFNDPRYWHRRVEEARVLAQQMSNEKAKETMLMVADDYDKLAIRALDQKSGFPTSRPLKLEQDMAFGDRVAFAVLATGIAAMSAAMVAGLLRGITLHDQRLVLLIASMLVALYSLFRDDEWLILLALGALVALYVPFVVFG
jgi:hypothetical protein